MKQYSHTISCCLFHCVMISSSETVRQNCPERHKWQSIVKSITRQIHDSIIFFLLLQFYNSSISLINVEFDRANNSPAGRQAHRDRYVIIMHIRYNEMPDASPLMHLICSLSMATEDGNNHLSK